MPSEKDRKVFSYDYSLPIIVTEVVMKFIYIAIFCTAAFTSLLLADDCPQGTTPSETLNNDTNFGFLYTLTENLAFAGARKGFFIRIANNCKYQVNVALALPTVGTIDLFGAADYEPLYVHGWWKIDTGEDVRLFFERKLTEKFAFHAHTNNNSMIWGKENIKYVVPGPDKDQTYNFIEYLSTKKCKADDNQIVTCTIEIGCK